MDNFIKKNISIVNKNTLLKIKIGKILGEKIFDSKIDDKILSKFLQNLYQLYPTLRKSKVDRYQIEYKLKNYIFEIEKGNIKDSYTYSNKCIENAELNGKSLKMLIQCIEDKEESKHSFYRFNSIEHKETLNYDINNLFTVSISSFCNKNLNWNTITIIIKRPNNSEILNNKIISIINCI